MMFSVLLDKQITRKQKAKSMNSSLLLTVFVYAFVDKT